MRTRMSQTQKSAARDAEHDVGAESSRSQPKLDEPKVAEPSLGDLSKRDYVAIFGRAGKKSIKDHIPNLAAALAYYAFLAIPSLLLISVGVFGLVANKDAVGKLVDRLETVAPPEALTLVRESLDRITESQANAGLAMIVVGSVLALWTLTGSMQTLMWALNT